MNDNNSYTISHIKYVEHPLIKKNSIEYRSYQDNIAKSARNKNTMIILPTALGKTVISALICADIMYNYKKLKILIMAPTRPLVLQHMVSFLSFLQVTDDQKVMMTGKTSPMLRNSIWKNDYIKLIFATPEIVKNDLLEKRINLDDFGLVIFDEAHRAVKDYAYTFIAKNFLESEKNPVTLAMTASPGSESERIKQVCDNLNIEHIEYRNEEDGDVKAYINPINTKWEWLDLPDEYISIASLLKSMLNEKLRWLSSRGLVKKKNIDYVFKKDLIELGNILKQNLKYSNPQNQGSIFYALMTQSAALSLMYCIELIESQGSFSLTTFMKRMEDSEGKTHSMLLKDFRMIEIKNRLSKNNNIVHPKIEYIVDLLKKYNNKNNNSLSSTKSKVLIFTHYRDTAKYLVDILEKNGIKSFRFVGQANRKDDIGMKQEEQSNILNSFRKGEFNVLIATSIAEEGLDIPQVDLVIFYEPIASEIRYIQRKGRTGRKSMGSVIILAAKNTVDERIIYANKRRIENMKRLLNNIKIKLEPRDRYLPKPDPYTEDEAK
ncbi:MAG: DEAD/DEAH box helicase [Nitrososphaeraceae archaeon]|nr:DEAD/DEAH box helicase [Nitrososphaeraceae archaeon]